MKGLSSKEVAERVKNKQTNKTKNRYTKSYARIVCENIFTVFNIITTVLFILILRTGEYLNALFIGVVVTNAASAIFHECRAKATVDRLNILSEAKAEVIRDSKRRMIPADEIVLDDIILLKSGQQVSADLEVIETQALEADESVITGESAAVEKKVGDMLFSGSFIVSGEAAAKAVAVGEKSYVNRIMRLAKKDKRVNSEVARFVKKLVNRLIYITIPLGVLLYMSQISGGISHNDSILGIGGSITGMIPSGLILICTVAMTAGVYKSSKKGVLIREAAATEALAKTDTLCIDKTGTLTTGNLKVESIVPKSAEFDKKLLSRLLCAFDDLNSTAKAILFEVGETKREEPELKIPFSSERKWMAAVFGDGTYILGAPEIVCKGEISPGRQRMLVFAKSAEIPQNKALPGNAEVLCHIILRDEVKTDAGDVIKTFKENDVDVKIISGDSPEVVLAIAKEAGIEAQACCDLTGMTDDEVYSSADKYDIFGRATPNQKKIIVKALKEKGKTVAMTGDGVNDIPAMRESNLAIAMASGNDAALKCGKIVLLDSSFSPLISVVCEGRSLVNNMERVSGLYLVKTIYSVIISICFILLGMKYPFEPMHLTIIGSLTVGAPSFFMALENNYSRIKKGFAKRIMQNALPAGLIVSINSIMLGILSKFGVIPSEAASLATVYIGGYMGVLTLAAVSYPMSRYRRIIVWLSGICTIGAFVILGKFIHLRIDSLYDLGLFGILAAVYTVIVIVAKKYGE